MGGVKLAVDRITASFSKCRCWCGNEGSLDVKETSGIARLLLREQVFQFSLRWTFFVRFQALRTTMSLILERYHSGQYYFCRLRIIDLLGMSFTSGDLLTKQLLRNNFLETRTPRCGS